MNSFLFIISLKICLNVSLVSLSHALMSSAMIPLLSGDLPLSLLIAVRNSTVVISVWDSHHHTGVTAVYVDAALIFVLTDFLFSFFLFIVVE